MKKRVVLLLMLVFSIQTVGLAKGRFGVGVPSQYQFNGMENSIYSPDAPVSGISSGYLAHLDLEGIPIMGVETYTVKLYESNTNEEISEIKFNFFDIVFDFEQKRINLLGGIGMGNVEFVCNVSACASIDFEKGDARHIFIQAGVPIMTKGDIHISIHRVYADVELSNSTTKSEMDLGGMMIAAGFFIGW